MLTFNVLTHASSDVWLEVQCHQYEIMIAPKDRSVDFYQYMPAKTPYYDPRSYQNYELYAKQNEWPVIEKLYTGGRALIEQIGASDEELDEGIAITFNIGDNAESIVFNEADKAPAPVQQYCTQLVSAVFGMVEKRFRTANAQPGLSASQ